MFDGKTEQVFTRVFKDLGISDAYINYAKRKVKLRNEEITPEKMAKELIVSESKVIPVYKEPIYAYMPVIGKSETNKLRTTTLNLHGFTTDGARALITRVLMNLDRSKPNVIKFNVGKGLHSANGLKLSDVLIEVCRLLKFEEPEVSTVNLGHYVVALPALASTEEE